MRTTGKMIYLSDVRERLSSKGNHFFSPANMRAFSSRVSENVYPTEHGTFIVTSERDTGVYTSYGFAQAEGWDKRKYTIRFVALDGHMCKYGDFGNYYSWNGAHKAAFRLQKTGFTTCEFEEGKCPHDWS